VNRPTPAPPEGRRDTALFRAFPDLVSRVPWMPLAHAPTAVEPCDAIVDYLGRGGVFQKRDDRVSPLSGGNKVRRFEYLLADAERKGARELVTVGGLASTQVMATVLFGRAYGFEVTAVLFDQPVTSFARKAILTSAAAGAHLIRGGGYPSTAWRTWRAYRRTERPYFIPPGASTPVANLGYVDAALELGEQVERGECPRPDFVVLPSGSGGTLAGLAIGFAILGWPTTVIGVRITDRIACNRVTIGHLIRSSTRYLRRHSERYRALALPAPRYSLFQGAIGKGYGYPTDDAVAAIPVIERLIGTVGEVTYSGKGLAGLRAVARAHPTSNILYWHTLSSAPSPPLASPTDVPDFARFFEGEVPV
jgi:1-aminocyclopropane-1-carboxylate deaminase/D-cysteine desulfhydrase-like pyridoxal-dependent ACC family enzyme